MIANRTCRHCELTLAEACVQAVPARLCGLCKLMGPGEVAGYMERWGKRWVNEIGDGAGREIKG